MSSTERPQSPFLDAMSFAGEEAGLAEQQEAPQTWYQIESPFRSMYELEEQDGMIEPEAEGFVTFLAELYDEEFDEAVFELMNEAADLYETRFEREFGSQAAGGAAAEHLLQQHFAPMIREAEALLEAMAEGANNLDLNTMTEAEVETFFDQYKPRTTQLSPAFENFFGGLINKVKSVAKKGIELAKKGVEAAAKLGLGPILNKLKKLIKPLLKKVLSAAINKLPPQLRPFAEKLAGRFLKKEINTETLEEDQEATGDITQIQREFDMQLANLLFVNIRDKLRKGEICQIEKIE